MREGVEVVEPLTLLYLITSARHSTDVVKNSKIDCSVAQKIWKT